MRNIFYRGNRKMRVSKITGIGIDGLWRLGLEGSLFKLQFTGWYRIVNGEIIYRVTVTDMDSGDSVNIKNLKSSFLMSVMPDRGYALSLSDGEWLGGLPKIEAVGEVYVTPWMVNSQAHMEMLNRVKPIWKWYR